MKILVTGATGFIGSHIAETVRARGHNVIGCVRDVELGERINPRLTYLACDFSADTDPDIWLDRLDGVDVVINAVGIITEQGRNRFRAIHSETPKALFKACEKKGVRRIIQISALGVSEVANTTYSRTKMEADDFLLSLRISGTVLRPSWLYGPRSESLELLSAFSVLPLTPLAGSGDDLVQPIHIDDFADGVARLAESGALDGEIVEAGGPERLTIAEVHAHLRSWLGLGPLKPLHVPTGLVRWAVKLGDHVFKGPVNTPSFDMLTRHNVTDDDRFWQVTGVRPNPMKAALTETPASRADQRHARVLFAMPLMRYALGLMWILTAVVTGFGALREDVLALFAEAGITGVFATILLPASLLIDAWLGLTLIFRHRLGLYGPIQIGLILFYTLFLTVAAPHWWLHPYGPLLKNVPLIAATIAVLVWERK